MSEYGIFIIESVRNGDYRDGHSLEKILNLSGIKTEYREATSKDDFIAHIEEFKHSGLRYLHISCHAAKDGFEIGDEDVPNDELEKIFGNSLSKRRVFLSACEAGNKDLAARLILKNGAFSVIGTPIELYFSKAAIFWNCLFHAIHMRNSKKTSKKLLTETLESIVNLLDVPINYYSFIRDSENAVSRKKIRKDRITSTRRLTINKVSQ